MARLMKDIIAYKENPFLDIQSITARNKKIVIADDTKSRLITETGEEKRVFIGSWREVDDKEFVKIFTSNISVIFDLNAPGNKVFQLLLIVVQKRAIQKDMIYISDEVGKSFSKDHGFTLSTSTFRRGLKNLLENQIIAKTEHINLYFINPHILFNGDRIAFFNAITRKKKEESVKKEILS